MRESANRLSRSRFRYRRCRRSRYPAPSAVFGGVTGREIFFIGYHQPDGRLSAGVGDVHEHFGKEVLWTIPSWNAALKAIG